MDSDLGHALAGCNTSNGWSTLDAVALKISKSMKRKVTPQELDTFMVEIGDEVLLQQGVWRTSFGPKLMSIVCVNRVFAKAAAEARVIGKAVAGSAGVGCTCAGSRAGATSSSTESSAAEVLLNLVLLKWG